MIIELFEWSQNIVENRVSIIEYLRTLDLVKAHTERRELSVSIETVEMLWYFTSRQVRDVDVRCTSVCTRLTMGLSACRDVVGML